MIAERTIRFKEHKNRKSLRNRHNSPIIDKILKKSLIDNVLHYKIKWKNYIIKKFSWEPYYNISFDNKSIKGLNINKNNEADELNNEIFLKSMDKKYNTVDINKYNDLNNNKNHNNSNKKNNNYINNKTAKKTLKLPETNNILKSLRPRKTKECIDLIESNKIYNENNASIYKFEDVDYNNILSNDCNSLNKLDKNIDINYESYKKKLEDFENKKKEFNLNNQNACKSISNYEYNIKDNNISNQNLKTKRIINENSCFKKHKGNNHIYSSNLSNSNLIDLNIAYNKNKNPKFINLELNDDDCHEIVSKNEPKKITKLFYDKDKKSFVYEITLKNNYKGHIPVKLYLSSKEIVSLNPQLIVDFLESNI